MNSQLLKLVFLVDQGDWPHCLVTNLYFRREVDGPLAYQTLLRSSQVVKMFMPEVISQCRSSHRQVKITREGGA